MLEPVELTISHADGHKCPRCWQWHTVQGNYLDLCDKCQLACLEGVGDWVERVQLTIAEGERLVAGIRASARRWRR